MKLFLEHQESQGSVTSTQKSADRITATGTPALSHQNTQDVDWLDVIPVEILPQPNQDTEQNTYTLTTRHNTDQIEIPQMRKKAKRNNMRISRCI